MVNGIVLVMSILLNDGSTVVSPAFPMDNLKSCHTRGQRIQHAYIVNVPDVKMNYGCYTTDQINQCKESK